VKELEKSGIGRPSTYATIMNKIQSRDYTEKEKGTLKPTELGRVIAEMLETNFKIIMDTSFTAVMEDDLERVAENQKNWKELLKQFWDTFSPLVDAAEKEAFVPRIMTDKICPECGHQLQKIWAKRKYFFGCSNYPTCNYTAPQEAVEFNKEDYDPSFNWDQSCPKCQKTMKLRFGKFGPFLGCESYPDCKGIVNIPKKGETPTQEMPPCPAIGCDGKICARRSRFGKVFYSCSNYPDCDVIANQIEDLEEKYANHPKTAYISKKPAKKSAKAKKAPTAKSKTTKKTASKKKKEGKGQPALTLSKELQAVVGEEKLSRPETIKKVWEYIKEKGLQDPKNKRLIVPDSKLAKVLGTKDPIDMMKLSGALGKHFT
jgi:DNA topoisomerase-1